jgi:hypothetical protein
MAAPQLVERLPAVNSNLFERNIPYRPTASAEQHLDLYAPVCPGLVATATP